MSKPALTPEDVAALTANLYVLSDDDLLVEANAVADNFFAWMDDQFDLTPEQSTYIAGFPEHVSKFWGYLFAAAFISRGPISFGAIPNNPPPRRIKELRANLFGDISYNDDDQKLEGSVEADVAFQLLD